MQTVSSCVRRSTSLVVKFFRKASCHIKKIYDKLPRFVWILLLGLSVAHTFFWVGMLQVDPIFWGCYWTSDKIGAMWIPELGLTYYDCFILFFNLAIFGFYTLVILILWLVSEYLDLKASKVKG